MNRREFIKSFARVVAAAPLLSPLLRGSGVRSPTLITGQQLEEGKYEWTTVSMPFHRISFEHDVYITKVEKDLWEITGHSDAMRGLTT